MLSWARRRTFPRLDDQNHAVTSPEDPNYNCAAWAVADDLAWWWPSPDPEYFWPPGARRDGTLEAFIEGYGVLGYQVGKSPGFEPGYEKIAIYATADGPQHVARQLESGRWTSKLGSWQDIEHSTLSDLEGDAYGRVALIMQRPRT